MKKPKPARGKAYGILNPYGDLWTYRTFKRDSEARAYIADFWRGTTSFRDLSAFKVVPVRVTVSAIQNAPKPEVAKPQAGASGQAPGGDNV